MGRRDTSRNCFDRRCNGGDCDVYLCGPPPMIDAAEAWLVESGVDGSQVHAEKFVPS